MEAQALSLAAALEQHSAHPVAHAICAAAAGGDCALEEVAELPGIGVKAQWQGHTVACGGLRLLQQAGIAPESLPAGMAEASAYLVQDGQVLAAFLTDFRLQEGAAELKEQLGKLGITRLEMLTGDRAAQAQAVAKAVGLTDAVHAELLPEDKLAEVKALQAEGLTTAFVGDGINDAPVLAAADVGIAMGLGSPAAIETADVVLVSGGLSRLAGAVRLCRRTVSTVHANIIFSPWGQGGGAAAGGVWYCAHVAGSLCRYGRDPDRRGQFAAAAAGIKRPLCTSTIPLIRIPSVRIADADSPGSFCCRGVSLYRGEEESEKFRTAPRLENAETVWYSKRG